ncbi:MAG: hypothetical protein ACI9WU_004131 [Myxococcota bacterium]
MRCLILALLVVGCAADSSAPVVPVDIADILVADATGDDVPEPVCDPEMPAWCLDSGQPARCASDGLSIVALPCAGVCADGICQPVQPNVLLVVDTSLSMTEVVDKQVPPWSCVGAGCPEWIWPDCDDAAAPLTRLGRIKALLRSILDTDEARAARLALMRFAQTPRDGEEPDCARGYWRGSDTITGDDDAPVAPLGGWFGVGLDQVLAVPLTDGMTAGDAMAPWLDEEEAGPGSPELRAAGGTPLGKALFYASEYLRQAVLVQGRDCEADADCASAHHSCEDGRCHDPIGHCRRHAIILLTDGGESVHPSVQDFFHPRVQAKRLQFGLGCVGDLDCLSGATCEEGVCRPSFSPPATACEVLGTACVEAGDCAAPDCAGEPGCPAGCGAGRVDHVEPISQRLTDAQGAAVAVTVHVVDASGIDGANALIAAYGGGLHRSVDLSDIDSVAALLRPLLDLKSDALCVAK